MQAEYFRIIENEKNDQLQDEREHLDKVVQLFEEREKWWKTDFVALNKMNSKSQQVKFTVPVVVDTVVQEEQALLMFAEPSNANYSDAELRDDAPENIEVRTERKSETKDYLEGSMQINAWDPETPYLKVMQYTDKGREYENYLKLKKEYGLTPAFYFDMADFFYKLGEKDTALLILSNIAELKLENISLLRIMAKKLIEFKQPALAVKFFETIVKLKGEEPQSYRDLGLAYSANGQNQKAVNSLYEIIKRDWDSRFPEIESIALEEMNAIIASSPINLDVSAIDKRLLKNLPVEIRVVLEWDTDNCDMDLWVTDPKGEKCFYNNKTTNIGGIISADFREGYGPEEFLLKKAVKGDYLVQVNYYGSRVQNVLAPVTLRLIFYVNYGTKKQKINEVSLRLEQKQKVVDVGKFLFE